MIIFISWTLLLICLIFWNKENIPPEDPSWMCHTLAIAFTQEFVMPCCYQTLGLMLFGWTSDINFLRYGLKFMNLENAKGHTKWLRMLTILIFTPALKPVSKWFKFSYLPKNLPCVMYIFFCFFFLLYCFSFFCFHL